MDQLMQYLPPAMRIKEEMKADIREGKYGVEGTPFMPVRDLANKVGVSLVTAQKVVTMLREEGLVRREGRRHVLMPLPEQIKTESPGNRLIGLLVTNLENPFFAQLTKLVEAAARARGLDVVTAGSDYDPVRENEILDLFDRKGVSGVLACPCGNDVSRKTFEGYRRPFVFIARKVEGIRAEAVLVHNHLAGSRVARHLIECGHEHFAYIGVKNFSADPRRQGFFNALSKHGFPEDSDQVLLVDNRDIHASASAMAGFLKTIPTPAGVFCFHDLIAANFLNVVLSTGLEVPDDIAIVGFDNLPVSSHVTPSLTTVAYPIDEMASIALDRLIAAMKGGGEGVDIHVSPRLVARESTRQGPASAPASPMMPECMAYSIG